MTLDEYEWRPITFQGVTFPRTVMAAAALEPILAIKDEELGAWLWKLRACCGVVKRSPASVCLRCARKLIDLLLDKPQLTMDGIKECLGPEGFDAAQTYGDWLLAFQRIAEISEAEQTDCSWSAPSDPRDSFKTADDFDNFMDRIERLRKPRS